MHYSQTDFAVLKLSKGTSLIEVLVALIIFAVGVLGIVGLQLTATNNAQINNQFIQAKLIASNLAGRLKLNKSYILHSQTLTIPNHYLSPQSFDVAQYGNCQGSKYECFCLELPIEIRSCRTISNIGLTLCDSSQLALFDIYEVSCMLALMSNEANINIYSSKLNDGALLLEINLIWPTTYQLNSELSSGCAQTIQALNKPNVSYMCYPQQLVLAVTSYES